MSIKLCFVQQKQYQSDVATKLNSFKSTLDSASISVKNQLNLDLLPQAEQSVFLQDVGRFYGETSNYVHLTTTQVLERISLVDRGQTSGLEGPAEIETLNKLIAHGLAASLVFLLHSVPSHVAGDLLVGSDGKSHDWFFAESKYIALIDEHFDYKHERQMNLAEIRGARRAKITF